MVNKFVANKNAKYFFFKSYTKKFNKGILNFYNFGIMSTSFGLVSARQLETLRRFISKRINKKCRRFHRLSLTHSIFKKGDKSRMGKGSGKFYKWFGYITPGSIIFEFSNYITDAVYLKKTFFYLQTKLPFKCKIISTSLFLKLSN